MPEESNEPRGLYPTENLTKNLGCTSGFVRAGLESDTKLYSPIWKVSKSMPTFTILSDFDVLNPIKTKHVTLTIKKLANYYKNDQRKFSSKENGEIITFVQIDATCASFVRELNKGIAGVSYRFKLRCICVIYTVSWENIQQFIKINMIDFY